MDLATEFYKLPLSCDPQRLEAEIDQFAEADWRYDRLSVKGYSSINLIAHEGRSNNDHVRTPMLPTQHLDRCPYVRTILSQFSAVLGEVRFRRMLPRVNIPEHYDAAYSGFKYLRFHIPVMADEHVDFWCNGQKVSMKPGEVWLFNRQLNHSVTNRSTRPRTHLIVDAIPSPTILDLIANSETPFARPNETGPANTVPIHHISYSREPPPPLTTAITPESPVAHPAEVERFLRILLQRLRREAGDDRLPPSLAPDLDRFTVDWCALWAQHGNARSGWHGYRKLATDFYARMERLDESTKFSDAINPSFLRKLRDFLRSGAFNVEFAPLPTVDDLDPMRSRFRLSESIQFYLTPSEGLKVWVPRDARFRSSSVVEMRLLLDITSKAHSSADVPDASSRLRQLLREGHIVPLEDEPPLRLGAPSIVANASANAEDECATPEYELPALGTLDEGSRLRLRPDVYLRLEDHGELWLWADNNFWSVDAYPVLCAIAPERTAKEIAAEAGTECDEAFFELLAFLIRVDLAEDISDRRTQARPTKRSRGKG